jgi:ER membrane protein complex subunit 4
MGPAKTIPMNAIMIYMSGTGVQIFSVMITAMLFWQPIKAIFTLNQSKSHEIEPSRYTLVYRR